jgi:hypothetical protein
MATSKSPKKGKSKKTKEAGAETKKLSALDAAAKVLAETGQPMACKEMIEAMAQKGYWSSPGGKTPASTLYTVVTMLPKWAPHGALIKRARRDPVDNSDLFVFNLDAFHQASNDFAARVPVGSM